MPEVLLVFLDGEEIPADTALIDFERPVLHVAVADSDSNNHEFTVPLSSLKYIDLGDAPEDPDAGLELGKVVIHFIDHEVMRAFAGRETLGGPYGVILTLVDPKRKDRRKIGVPYSSVKAIFKVKTWDSRADEQLTKPSLVKPAARPEPRKAR